MNANWLNIVKNFGNIVTRYNEQVSFLPEKTPPSAVVCNLVKHYPIFVTIFGKHIPENGEFCVAVAPATRTAGILTQLIKGAVC